MSQTAYHSTPSYTTIVVSQDKTSVDWKTCWMWTPAQYGLSWQMYLSMLLKHCEPDAGVWSWILLSRCMPFWYVWDMMWRLLIQMLAVCLAPTLRSWVLSELSCSNNRTVVSLLCPSRRHPKMISLSWVNIITSTISNADYDTFLRLMMRLYNGHRENSSTLTVWWQ